ncbi:acetyltransferase, GNAT family [[Synechococcus] sp. NIES-970]|nr:acetyltransferase, GNAT family [[Synechococcus] sp. NIES-970]
MLPTGFSIRQGKTADRPLLLKFLHRSYQEFYPETGFAHLQDTLGHYFTAETPLWWAQSTTGLSLGCLWLGSSIDQISGDRHSHIFLLYVLPDYRRQGIGSALMATAEDYAKTRGDRQISLQVFHTNQMAQAFYQNLAYCPHAVLMRKMLP